MGAPAALPSSPVDNNFFLTFFPPPLATFDHRDQSILLPLTYLALFCCCTTAVVVVVVLVVVAVALVVPLVLHHTGVYISVGK